jgi:hypothetical protein
VIFPSGHAYGTVNRLGNVGYLSASPAAKLIAKDAPVGSRLATDCALGDDSTALTAGIGDGGYLDHEPALGDVDLQGGVIELERSPPGDHRLYRLERAAVELDE